MSVLGLRPTATSNFSNSRACFFPAGSLKASLTPLEVSSILSTAVSAKTSMPLALNARSSPAETSSSSRGTTRGSISKRATSAPKLRYIEANSTPTAPAPMTASDPGTCSRSRTSTFVRTRPDFTSKPGSMRASEPVARTMCAAFSVRSPSGPATLTLPAPCNVAYPAMVLILCRLNSCRIPVACLPTISVLRLPIVLKSIETLSASTPICLPLSADSYTSAKCSKALVGIQPTCRQVPPK